jgi:hypothetical protein
LFCKPFRIKEINELEITVNKLTNSFTVLVTNGHELDVARGPPVGPR